MIVQTHRNIHYQLLCLKSLNGRLQTNFCDLFQGALSPNKTTQSAKSCESSFTKNHCTYFGQCFLRKKMISTPSTRSLLARRLQTHKYSQLYSANVHNRQRLGCSARKSDHITPLLHDLHWLPVPQLCSSCAACMLWLHASHLCRQLCLRSLCSLHLQQSAIRSHHTTIADRLQTTAKDIALQPLV